MIYFKTFSLFLFDQNRIQISVYLFIREILNLVVRQLFEHRTYICLFFFILMSKFRVSELIKSPIINQVLFHFLYVEIHLIYAIIILGNVININDLVYRGSFSLFLVRVQRLSFILFLWSCVQALSKISICKSKLRLRVPEHSI